MHKKVIKTPLLLFVSLILGACSITQPSSEEMMQITDTQWQLLTINNQEISPLKKDFVPFIAFEKDTKVYGYDGCNRFFGSYETSENSLELSPLAGTKMFCEDMMEIADQFMRALVLAKNYEIKENQLNLYDDNETLLLKFSPTPLP